MGFILVAFIVALVLTFFIKEDLKRLRSEKNQRKDEN